MTALVSIVIPCYNSGKYILEAINSAAEQRYPDKEILVMDDGSTDKLTLAVLETVKKDPRVSFFSQKNAGPAAARNAAIKKASGKYILPLDSDDLIDPTYIEKAVALLENDASLGVVYCDAKKFGAESGYWYLPDFSLEEMVIDNIVFCTSVYRRADWELVGGYPDLRKGMEDYGFWLRLLRRGRRFHKLKEPLFFYRIQDTSRTTDFYDDKEGMVHTYAEIFRDNVDFFAAHAETIYRNRFSLYDKIKNLESMIGHVPFRYYLKERVRCSLDKKSLLYRFLRASYHTLKSILKR